MFGRVPYSTRALKPTTHKSGRKSASWIYRIHQKPFSNISYVTTRFFFCWCFFFLLSFKHTNDGKICIQTNEKKKKTRNLSTITERQITLDILHLFAPPCSSFFLQFVFLSYILCVCVCLWFHALSFVVCLLLTTFIYGLFLLFNAVIIFKHPISSLQMSEKMQNLVRKNEREKHLLFYAYVQLFGFVFGCHNVGFGFCLFHIVSLKC